MLQPVRLEITFPDTYPDVVPAIVVKYSHILPKHAEALTRHLEAEAEKLKVHDAATPMASASDHAQGVFAHDPYMDAFARQLQHQPQLAAGVAQQLPIFPHVPLESSLTTHLRQAVVDSLKPAGGGLGGGEGGGAGGGWGEREERRRGEERGVSRRRWTGRSRLRLPR